MWGGSIIGRAALIAAWLDHIIIRPALCALLPVKAVVALYSSSRGVFLKCLSEGRFAPVAGGTHPITVMGLEFRNDLGNAAGLDKDGVMCEWFWRSGAGFAIIGTVLDAPHTGNVWSFGGFCPWLPLPSGGNGLNSLGLPSKGCAKALENIQKFKDNHTEEELAGFPIGLSIMGHPAKQGAAKLEGVLQCVRDACAVCDFIELNESCPNVAGHDKPGTNVAELEARISAVLAARDEATAAAGKAVPLLIKFGSLAVLGDVETTVRTLDRLGCDGVTGLNTQTDYAAFESAMPPSDYAMLQTYTAAYKGGLSGPVIFPRSLSQAEEAAAVIKKHKLKLCLVHCGGIVTPADMRRSRATGAELREWYTGLFTAVAERSIGEIYPGMTADRKAD